MKQWLGFKIVQLLKNSNTIMSWMSLRQSLLKCVRQNIIYTVRCYDWDAPKHCKIANFYAISTKLSYFWKQYSNYIDGYFILNVLRNLYCYWYNLIVHVLLYLHIGYCTEYNSLGAAMQEDFSLKCSDVKPPCNTSYLFSDAYLCK